MLNYNLSSFMQFSFKTICERFLVSRTFSFQNIAFFIYSAPEVCSERVMKGFLGFENQIFDKD